MEKASKLAEKAKKSIEAFRDTVKLKAHLGSMDSKDAWDKFETQLDIIRDDIKTFTDKAKQDSDEARLQGHLALMNAQKRWDHLKDAIDLAVESMASEAKGSIDQAKLKASLAKLETKDLIDKAEMQRRFQSLGDEIKEDWYKFLTKFDERIVDFINRFPLR